MGTCVSGRSRLGCSVHDEGTTGEFGDGAYDRERYSGGLGRGVQEHRDSLCWKRHHSRLAIDTNTICGVLQCLGLIEQVTLTGAEIVERQPNASMQFREREWRRRPQPRQLLSPQLLPQLPLQLPLPLPLPLLLH